MTRVELSDALVGAVRAAVAAGELAGEVPEAAPLSRTKAGVCSSPLALRLAGQAGRPAQEVAEIIVRRLGAGATVTGAGFITFENAEAEAGVVTDILEAGRSYGVREVPRPEKGWPDRPRTFDNPGFVVRFGFARAVAVRRWAGELGIKAKAGELAAAEEKRLLGLLEDFPGRVELAVRKQSAAPLVHHLERTAEAYHDVHERCPAEVPARVALAEAVEITLRNGLLMLGENPRERI